MKRAPGVFRMTSGGSGGGGGKGVKSPSEGFFACQYI